MPQKTEDDSLEVMCHRAVTLGIPEIGFSEHWDVSPYEKIQSSLNQNPGTKKSNVYEPFTKIN